MHRNIVLIVSLLCTCTVHLEASNVIVRTPVFYYEDGEATVQVEIAWDNAWNNTRNRDAIWVFAKFIRNDQRYRHMQVEPAGHSAINLEAHGPALEVTASNDGMGLFVSLAQPYRGDVSALLTFALDTASFRSLNHNQGHIQVFGIEMVYVPAGGFYLGDADPRAREYAAMFLSDAAGNASGHYFIEGEEVSIDIAPRSGALYYQSDTDYRGDQGGPVPADFPKGVAAFYCMKYELTQGQYAAFLNYIAPAQTQFRANFGLREYYSKKGTIALVDGAYVAGKPERPCNYYSWDDAMAYADWAGLRPMTEFEFTKACRGPGKPQAMEYPWGTGSKYEMLRRVNGDHDLVMLNGMDESQLSDDTRHLFGASYYRVMDLAGSLWERVITIGDEKGRAFTGNHGDGHLTGSGFANVDLWPAGNQENGGFGFRGGGFYFHERAYHIFNPYSPIAFRPFGAWSGGNRAEGYGGRFVRTADQE